MILLQYRNRIVQQYENMVATFGYEMTVYFRILRLILYTIFFMVYVNFRRIGSTYISFT